MLMKTDQIVLSRLLPKTGQTASDRTGDDGYHEAGWWKGLLISTNRTRFILRTIGSEVVTIDNATGLMWASEGNDKGCNDAGAENWDDAIDYANALTFAGYSDWRIPNILELLTVIDFAASGPMEWDGFFAYSTSENHWTSTSWGMNVAKAFVINFDTEDITQQAKSIPAYLRCVRGGL